MEGEQGKIIEKDIYEIKEQNKLKEIFGENSEIKKNEDKWTIKGKLASQEVKGGQEFQIQIGPRKTIPILLPESYGKMDGLIIENMLIDSQNISDSYQIFVDARIENDGEMISIFENFADKNSKTIAIHSLKSGNDLAVLNHEKGHVEDGDIDQEEYGKRGEMLSELAKKNIDKDGNYDGIALAKNKKFLKILKYIIQTEMRANKWAISRTPSNQQSEVELFLTNNTYENYLEMFGDDFIKTLGESGVKELLYEK